MTNHHYGINTDSEYGEVKKILSRGDKPHRVLRLLMNALESYRQSRKLGWSRPWNKVNLMNFQSFRLDREQDRSLFELAADVLIHDGADMPQSAKSFADDLLNSPQLMAFVFVHEYEDNGRLYEGATLSLGRVNNKKYRDRIDLIVEAPVVEGITQGLSRLRVFVDPYSGDKAPLWTLVQTDELSAATRRLFQRLSEISNQWASRPEKHWHHWTSDYIDYFGARRHPVKRSCFHIDIS